MKVVITRDDDGYMRLWRIEMLKKLRKEKLAGRSFEWNGFCAGRLNCCDEEDVCKLLGFTPRKGSKQVVDITAKRLKK